jgi:hypothetical protein
MASRKVTDMTQPNPTASQRKRQPAPLPCEHLTFVTCRVCGLTYEQRQTQTAQRQGS